MGIDWPILFGVIGTFGVLGALWASYLAGVRRDERQAARMESHATTVTGALGEVKTEVKDMRKDLSMVSDRVARVEGALGTKNHV